VTDHGAVVNHIGHCVADLERARRFYTEVFGFEVLRELRPPDDPTARLVRVDAPVNMTALYLGRGSLVLELLWFDREGNPPPRDRAMNEPGLTHLSFSVDDVATTSALVETLGGRILHDTDLAGMAVMIRDPDGQLIEILPMSYRDMIAGD
jgi:lactoylglutathione lyase